MNTSKTLLFHDRWKLMTHQIRYPTFYRKFTRLGTISTGNMREISVVRANKVHVTAFTYLHFTSCLRETTLQPLDDKCSTPLCFPFGLRAIHFRSRTRSSISRFLSFRAIKTKRSFSTQQDYSKLWYRSISDVLSKETFKDRVNRSSAPTEFSARFFFLSFSFSSSRDDDG